MWSSFVSVFVPLIKCLKLKRLTFCWLNLMNVLTVHIFPDYLIFTFFSYLCDIVDLLTSNLAVWFVTIRQHKLLLWTTDFNYGCFGSTFINSQIKVNIQNSVWSFYVSGIIILADSKAFPEGGFSEKEIFNKLWISILVCLLFRPGSISAPCFPFSQRWGWKRPIRQNDFPNLQRAPSELG